MLKFYYISKIRKTVFTLFQITYFILDVIRIRHSVIKKQMI